MRPEPCAKPTTRLWLQDIVDLVVVVDDASHDETVSIAQSLPNTIVHTHPQNLGYGANQKTCYKLALQQNADIIIMVHPDYQYTPKLIPTMASMIGNDLYPCVLGSRILGRIRLERQNAALEICCKSLSDLCRKYFHRRKALRIPHRLQGLLTPASPTATLRSQFRRFCF